MNVMVVVLSPILGPLDAMFAAVDKLPQTPRNDGLSNRDHDQILYGSPQ